jgi:hypothetical protein
MSTTQADPLRRVRRELVMAAARANHRRRRRRILLLVVLPVLLLAASAGGAAVGGLGTGVPAVDRLLSTDGSHDGTDPSPASGDASEPLALPNAPDGKQAAVVAYVSRDGRICEVEADLRRRDDAPRGSDGGPCFTTAELSRILSVRRALCCASSHAPERRIYHGLVAGDVIALRFRREDGTRFDARLTPAWTPDLPGAEPLRLFVAVDERDIDVGGDGVQPGEAAALMPRYRVEAKLRDGRSVAIRAP